MSQAGVQLDPRVATATAGIPKTAAAFKTSKLSISTASPKAPSLDFSSAVRMTDEEVKKLSTILAPL